MVLIKPKIICYNAFAAAKTCQMTMKELGDYCQILSDKLTDNGYKYMVFDVDDKDFDEFCAKDTRFIKGITKIVSTEIIRTEDADKVNSIYEQKIQEILKETRKIYEGGISE